MKYLVTGGAGFVGTNLSKHLIERGDEVLVTDSLQRQGSEKNIAYLRDTFDVDFLKADIERIPQRIKDYCPDIVYHFAAQVAVTDSEKEPAEDFRTNAQGTFGVALAAKEVGAKLIYTSTNKVYGNNVNKVPLVEKEDEYDFDSTHVEGISEDFSVDASHHTPYGVSKLVGELYTREFGGIANRCSCMFGNFQYGNSDQGWISHFMRKEILGQPITIYGDGKQVRDILHIDDVVHLLSLQAESLTQGRNAGETFNVGGGPQNKISLLQLLDVLNVSRDSIIFEDWRPADQKVFYCNTKKAQQAFGWEPKVTKEEGLKKLYEWTKKDLGKN